MLPKFIKFYFEDAYLLVVSFSRMIKLQHLTQNAINISFIPFSHDDNAKKWLYNMLTDSFIS